jgi:hypothetical protein
MYTYTIIVMVFAKVFVFSFIIRLASLSVYARNLRDVYGTSKTKIPLLSLSLLLVNSDVLK